jgi:hypothetical protein
VPWQQLRFLSGVALQAAGAVVLLEAMSNEMVSTTRQQNRKISFLICIAVVFESKTNVNAKSYRLYPISVKKR